MIRAQTEVFVAAFVQRIEGGLLLGTTVWLCQYEVARKGSEGFRFRAISWWTAIDVGLNDVEAAISGERADAFPNLFLPDSLLGGGDGSASRLYSYFLTDLTFLQGHRQTEKFFSTQGGVNDKRCMGVICQAGAVINSH